MAFLARVFRVEIFDGGLVRSATLGELDNAFNASRPQCSNQSAVAHRSTKVCCLEGHDVFAAAVSEREPVVLVASEFPRCCQLRPQRLPLCLTPVEQCNSPNIDACCGLAKWRSAANAQIKCASRT